MAAAAEGFAMLLVGASMGRHKRARTALNDLPTGCSRNRSEENTPRCMVAVDRRMEYLQRTLRESVLGAKSRAAATYDGRGSGCFSGHLI